MRPIGVAELLSLSWFSSLARITTATVSPITPISATASSARSWLKCDRRTTAGCCVGTAWPMCASCSWAAAGAARPVVVVMADIGGDHGRGRLQAGQGAITGWKTAAWRCPGAAVRWGSRLAWLFAWSSASSRPPEVLDEGRRLALGGRKPRALLALLLLHRGETLGA